MCYKTILAWSSGMTYIILTWKVKHYYLPTEYCSKYNICFYVYPEGQMLKCLFSNAHFLVFIYCI